MERNDWTLLREYVEDGSEAAFEALVRRHLDMVYATAWRQTGDASLAEEVAQVVFLLLARRSPQLQRGVIIAGWLYRTTCLTALRALRDRTRRQRREREAAAMIPDDSDGQLWASLMPHLDAALEALGEQDRLAVVLRFLEAQSFRNVAATLGVSEDAAKKRVNRALEKLHLAFTRQGLKLSLAAMSIAIATKAVQAAPANLLTVAVQAGLSDGLATGSTVRALAAEMLEDSTVQSLEQIEHSLGTAASGAARLPGTLRAWLNLGGALTGATLLVLAVLIWLWPRGANAKQNGAGPSEQSSGQVGTELTTMRPERTVRAFASANAPAMLLRFLAEEDGQPLAGVPVHLEFTVIPNSVPGTFVTDAQGSARILLPNPTIDGMSAWVWTKGRVPMAISWPSKQSVEARLPEYTVRVPRGRFIAGTVVDEEGNPVSSATVHFQGEGLPWNSREYADYQGLASLSEADRPPAVVSDSNGRWSAEFFSPTAKSVFGYVQHPSYATTQFGHVQPPDPVEPSTNMVLVLKRGTAVDGFVRDPAGQPIPKAWVGLRDPLGLPFRSTSTDARGWFEFRQIDLLESSLNVQAKGFRPVPNLSVRAGSNTNFEVVLTPISPVRPVGNSVIRGRVASEDGNPLSNIEVRFVPGQPGLEGNHWNSTTDANGRFVWAAAPDRPVKLLIRGSGWDWEEQRVELVPDGGEALITLRPKAKIHVHGAVWDMTTGNFVPTFKVLWAPGFKSGYIVNTSVLTESRDGTFAVDMLPRQISHFSPPGSSTRLDFQAPGYVNKIVLLTPGTNDIELAVELEPAVDIAGSVVQPEGDPAGGARVSFRGEHFRSVFWPELFTAKLSDQYPFAVDTRAEADGTFHIPKIDGVQELDVVHPAGWAVLSLGKGAEYIVHLKPWGRIQGVLQSDDGPVSGAEVDAEQATRDLPQMQFSLQAKTDAEGHFEFPQVPGGRAVISVTADPHRGDRLSLSQALEVQPGQTAEVKFQLGRR